MKEGGSSLNKTFREYNLVFKGLRRISQFGQICCGWVVFCECLVQLVNTRVVVCVQGRRERGEGRGAGK